MGITTSKRVLASALVAVLVLAICEVAPADEGESAASVSALETVVVFPLRHSGEAEQSDVEFLDNLVLAGFEKLPRDRFAVAVGRGGGMEFCDEGCVELQLRESGGDYAIHGVIERRDSGFFVDIWLVRIGDDMEQLGREEVGGALITLGVICAVGAFGLGFAYGLTMQWPYLAAGIGTEALGVVLIVSGSVARVRAGRGMEKYGLARLEPGDLGGFDPAAHRLATAPRLGLALGFEF